jgi:hypothetical protein
VAEDLNDGEEGGVQNGKSPGNHSGAFELNVVR